MIKVFACLLTMFVVDIIISAPVPGPDCPEPAEVFPLSWLEHRKRRCPAPSGNACGNYHIPQVHAYIGLFLLLWLFLLKT